jgi:hypothetical protein
MKTAEYRECEDEYQEDWDTKGNTCDYTEYYDAYCKSLGPQYIWDADSEEGGCIDSCEAKGEIYDTADGKCYKPPAYCI